MGTAAATYRAAVVRDARGPDSIEIIDVPVRELAPDEVRVAVAAASINPVDVGVARGRFHAMGLIHQLDHTGLGWDFAGTVLAMGHRTGLRPGARVAGFIEGFDRDFGAFAEQITVPQTNIAEVPGGFDLIRAATVPLNAIAAAQALDLLGDPAPGRNRLLVTGAAGAVGGYVTALASQRGGWAVTGLARPGDESFVRSLGAHFVSRAHGGWDAVIDGAVLQEHALDLVGDGGTFVGVQPALALAGTRGVDVRTVVAQPDSARLANLLSLAHSGDLPTRVQRVLPLEDIAEGFRAAAEGGARGRYVLTP